MILTRCASSCQRSRRGSASKLNHADHLALIEDGVEGRGGRWADLGSGEGAFTLALADVLGPEAHIVAVDKDSTRCGRSRGASRPESPTSHARWTLRTSMAS